MRLLSRTEFLALPPGALFTKWPNQGELAIKLETLPNAGDYYELDFGFPTPVVNGVLTMPFDDVPVGESFPVDYASQRDGLFDEEQQYLVYEPADLEQLLVLMFQNIPYLRDRMRLQHIVITPE
jgi:hypothetical protein